MKPATQASSWYQNTAGSATIPPHVAERALEWLIDLQDEPVAPELIEEWHCWLNADPDHERAWQRIESINHRLQPLTAPMHAVMAQAVLAAPGSARRRQLVKSLAVLLCVGGGSWGLLNTMQWRTWNADYHTAVGEQRTLVLSDGTELILNTDSAINVQYQEHERRIRLIYRQGPAGTPVPDRNRTRHCASVRHALYRAPTGAEHRRQRLSGRGAHPATPSQPTARGIASRPARPL